MTNKINPSVEGYAAAVPAARAFEPHLYVAAAIRAEDAHEAYTAAWAALMGCDEAEPWTVREGYAVAASYAGTELWQSAEALEAFGD